MDTPPVSSKIMTLGQHLDELRARLIVCLLGFGVCFLVLLCLGNLVSDFLRLPLERAVAWTDLPPADKLRLSQWNTLGPLDGFSAVMKFSFFLALAMSLPLWLHQTWEFVRPGLLPREKSGVRPILLSGAVLFAAGSAIGFFYASPLALRCLISFNAWIHVDNQWTAPSVIAFVQTVCIGFGLACELPIAMLFLGKVGILRTETLRRYRRHAVVAFFVLGAIFTPPDPGTQIMMASLLILLYEAGILLVRMMESSQPSTTANADGTTENLGQGMEPDDLCCEDYLSAEPAETCETKTAE